MIGSCHGERLPPLPPATHGNGEGLKPIVTARQALASIGPHTTLHNVEEVKSIDASPWHPDHVLPRTITCSGGQNYHWSGTRHLTLREFASFQGFPIWHSFCAPYIKKQIGNAFPPCVVKVLYQHIRVWLLEEDKVVPVALAGSAMEEEMVEGLQVVTARRLSASAAEFQNLPAKFEIDVVRFIGREVPEVIVLDDSDLGGSDTEEDGSQAVDDSPMSNLAEPSEESDSDTETLRGDDAVEVDSDSKHETLHGDDACDVDGDSDSEHETLRGDDTCDVDGDGDEQMTDYDSDEGSADENNAEAGGTDGDIDVVDLT